MIAKSHAVSRQRECSLLDREKRDGLSPDCRYRTTGRPAKLILARGRRRIISRTRARRMILQVVYAGGGVIAGEFVSIGDQPTAIYALKGVVVVAGVENIGTPLQGLNESLRSDQYVRLM